MCMKQKFILVIQDLIYLFLLSFDILRININDEN